MNQNNKNKNLLYIQMDASQMNFENDYFDFIFDKGTGLINF